MHRLIPGFNLTYNDIPDPPPPEPKAYHPPPPPPKATAGGLLPKEPHFRHTTSRAALRAKGKLPGADVINSARARADGKALRAADGAVLKVPYVVRLKSR